MWVCGDSELYEALLRDFVECAEYAEGMACDLKQAGRDLCHWKVIHDRY